MSALFPIPRTPSAGAELTALDGVPGDPSEARHAARRTAAAGRLLEGLNDPQRAAVTHAGAPLLVVAGAGSGKTQVLTRRIAWLIAERDAHPGSILAITFTNKAAAQMRERVESLVGRRSRIMWVSTFHSACVRILRKEVHRFGFRSSFSIYDAADSRRLMTLVCRDLDLDPKRYPPRAVSNWVSNAKNELVDHEAATSEADNDQAAGYAQAYAMYQRRLWEANALDFDDLILTSVHLLQSFPEVRDSYRRRFRHVLVDEYQDTNHAQYALVREFCGEDSSSAATGGEPAGPAELRAGPAELRAGPAELRAGPAELMVVGDADQSIYAFRGASIRNILQFESDFPSARTIFLEQNYRSTQTILNAANAVIGRNSDRKPKNLWSDGGNGEPIVGYVADDEHDEARFVSGEIDRLTDCGAATPADVAVFYRTNAQSRVFEEVFLRVGMPYKVVGGVRFYERREVRDALAYLRTLANPADQVSLRRILNVPKRGIGERAQACVDALAQRERIPFWEALRRAGEAPGIATRSVACIATFVALVEQLQSLVEFGERADVVVEQVLARSGYLAELEASDDPQDQTRVENLAELVAVAREFADEPEAVTGDAAPGPGTAAGQGQGAGLPEFLERVALVADSDQIPDRPDGDGSDGDGGGVVTLMTLHTAKGLEFPVVFLTGLEEGVFPHSRSLGAEAELEEERRLAYVGLTRARERLYVSRALVRSAWGAPAHNGASRFLSELPTDLVDWRRTEAAQTSWTRPVLGSESARAAGQLRRRFGTAAIREDSVAKSKARTQPVPSLSPGDRVLHDSFGLGSVVSMQGAGGNAVAAVDFGSGGVKRLLLRYAPVQKL